VCKEGDCGACVLLVGEIKKDKVIYKSINSCLFPILKVCGKHVVTIEGLNQSSLNPIQESFVNEGASQCGFCTPGFLVSITGYLLNSSEFNIDEAVNAVAGNICRCTGYHSIKRSLSHIRQFQNEINYEKLISEKIIPPFFKEILPKLEKINSASKQKKSKEFSQLVSGGTDLFVQKPEDLLESEIEIIENHIEPEVRAEDDRIFISGSASVLDLESFVNSNTLNFSLDRLFKLFASLPIRSSATIAGNIINASPIADITISLLALNAELTLSMADGNTRNVLLRKFYKGYKNFDISPKEIINTITIKQPSQEDYFNFEKVSKRTHLDIASVNSAINLKIFSDRIINASISAGGVAPVPLYLRDTSKFLLEKIVSDKVVKKCIDIALSEIKPISDIRGSAEYKSLLLSQLIKAHFLALFPETISADIIHE